MFALLWSKSSRTSTMILCDVLDIYVYGAHLHVIPQIAGERHYSETAEANIFRSA